MKKHLFLFTTLIVSVLFFTGCKETDEEINKAIFHKITLEVTAPLTMEEATLSDIKVKFTNLLTKNDVQDEAVKIAGNTVTVTLLEGNYNVSFQANVSFKANGIEREVGLSNEQVIEVNKKSSEEAIKLTFTYTKSSSSFVIEEIFFTGTETPEGKQYNVDKYFKITNNSDETLYADKIAIIESVFLSTQKQDYLPNIIDKAMATNAIYRIPGTGKDYPIEPGKSLIICDNAINHKESNANSFDLSKADFEWFDDSTNPKVQDIDNPEVPNLEKIYCYTKTIWSPHNRGFKSYAIAKIDMSKDEYLKKNKYDYYYIFKQGDFEKKMESSEYSIPNEWIIDAVNLSVEAGFKWIPISSSLDAGWSYCGKTMSDKTRYGKAVRRKIVKTENGRNYLQDTNNSTNDFEPEVKPSLMK